MAEKVIKKPVVTEKNAETVAPATEKTKTKIPKTLVIVLAVIGGLVLLGFILSFAGSMFVGSQILKNVGLDTSTDGKTVTIGSGDEKVTVSDTQKWPDTVPASVPELTAGKITSAARFGETWSITATDVTVADYTAYVSALKSNGYTMDEDFEMTSLRTSAGVKNGYRVSVTYTEDEDDRSMLIGVTKEEN